MSNDPAFDHPSECAFCQTYDARHHRDCPQNPAVVERTASVVKAKAATYRAVREGDVLGPYAPEISRAPGAINVFDADGNPARLTPLPAEPLARKGVPIATGFIDYFPDAVAAVAELSRIGNDQHNPGKPLHWDRSKSGDESDALMRHFVERGTIDTDGVRHSAKVAWRALAMLQKELEAARQEQPL